MAGYDSDTQLNQCDSVYRGGLYTADLLVDAGITILLALSVYQMIVSQNLPATSDAVPLLGTRTLSLNHRSSPQLKHPSSMTDVDIFGIQPHDSNVGRVNLSSSLLFVL